MDIKETKSNIKLDLPKFECDNKLTNKNINPLPNETFYMVFSGPPRSGKTSLALSLLTTKKDKRKKTRPLYRKVFDKIYVIMPTSSLRSLQRNPFEGIAQSQIYNELDETSLLEIINEVKMNSEDGLQSLLFIDDMTAYLKNSSDVIKIFNELIANRRHYRTSVMMMVQFMNSIPLSNRKLVTHLVSFKTSNKKETESILGELIHIPKDQYHMICNHCWKNKHDFLYVDIGNGTYHRCFNRLEF